MIIRVGIGQDSHRFLPPDIAKPCILGGMIFEDMPGLQANSDGDVIFHAICNAISSVTGVLILGQKADEMFKNEGITDSGSYLAQALKTLGKQKIMHVSIALEGTRPRFLEHICELRKNVSDALDIQLSQVGITATTGEGLTDFGCGIGLQCFCTITTSETI